MQIVVVEINRQGVFQLTSLSSIYAVFVVSEIRKRANAELVSTRFIHDLFGPILDQGLQELQRLNQNNQTVSPSKEQHAEGVAAHLENFAPLLPGLVHRTPEGLHDHWKLSAAPKNQ